MNAKDFIKFLKKYRKEVDNLLNMFACDRKVIELLCKVIELLCEVIELLCEDGGEDHRFIKKIDIGDKKVSIHFLKDNRKTSLDFTYDRLAETYFNIEIMKNPEFENRVKSNSIVYKDFKRKLDEELSYMKDNGQEPEYDTLFETTIALLIEGKLPFGQTDAGIKIQKNENAGRNKKKAAEKKAEALADNEKKLPKAEDIDTAGMETKGVETPGETVQEDDDKLKEEKIVVPKNFRRTNDQLARGLSAEDAYKEKLDAESDALIKQDKQENNDLGFLADA